MRKYISIPIMAIMIFFVTACNKTEENNPCETFAEGHLIFGTYYGECIGDCAQFFKINNCQVFADDMISYYTEDLKFQSTPMTIEDYEIALDASSMFPEALWNESDTIFGIPDAYDQGGIYLERNVAGEIRSWNIDTNEEVLPSYLAEYAALLKTIILELDN